MRVTAWRTGGWLLALALAASPFVPAAAGTRDHAIQGYALPADKPVTIILMRPDVSVGLLQAGGITEPNADWTRDARANLQTALEGFLAGRAITLRTIDPADASDAKLVAEYNALHQSVAAMILQHKYDGDKLPTKKDKFDWGLGAEAARLADLSGGSSYALFLYTRDDFGSDARKAMQFAGALGCIVGFCAIVSGGRHVALTSLVELETGRIVWFNVLRGSKGDVREAEGATKMVAALYETMPTRASAATKAASPVGEVTVAP